MRITFISLLLLGTVTNSHAAVTLDYGDNVNILAAQSAKMSTFSNSVTLPDGEQTLIVRFDAPNDPGSMNENQGRIISNAHILTFTVNPNSHIKLKTEMPLSVSETQAVAKSPTFYLTDSQGKPIPFNAKSVSPEYNRFGTDYAKLLPTISQHPVAEVKKQDKAEEKPQVVSTLQTLYLQMSDEQKKEFLRWAIGR
ncbi:DUF2057 family protein [Serratia oryzae]|jgi:uncharacterized protein YccT (UPF0319 family)|uniref:Uncharacterized protein n=1 Tax=Serratia oryzae TaxID=2034155 RepID=A0A1S8CEJ1_9GAMM|nr:DUF2057 family protein [Serratia oryzae]OMQ20001.1 hypothetical protein BMI79_20060 [Serratia oryzae]